MAILTNFSPAGPMAITAASVPCRSRISEHPWKLQFQLRETAAPEAADDAQVLELAVVEAARDLMHRVLSGDDKSRVEKIAKKLSRIVDLPRDDWPLGFIRSLADDLLDEIQQVTARR